MSALPSNDPELLANVDPTAAHGQGDHEPATQQKQPNVTPRTPTEPELPFANEDFDAELAAEFVHLPEFPENARYAVLT